MTKQNLQESKEYLESKGFGKAEIGIILGTGLGKMVDEIQNPIEVEYSDIPHFPVSMVEFHKGKLIYGTIEGKTVMVMQGRFHLYEGYNLQQVTYPLRVMSEFGIQHLFVSNAAGAINLDYKKGDLMLIEDHINLQPGSPLAFANANEFGERFVDMYEPYDVTLRNKVSTIAEELKIPLQKGIYVSVVGPQLETKAEYRYLKIIGADAVGMSTVPEVIVANQLNIKTLAISVLTDECDPDNLQPVNIPEIIQIATQTEPKLIQILKQLITTL